MHYHLAIRIEARGTSLDELIADVSLAVQRIPDAIVTATEPWANAHDRTSTAEFLDMTLDRAVVAQGAVCRHLNPQEN